MNDQVTPDSTSEGPKITPQLLDIGMYSLLENFSNYSNKLVRNIEESKQIKRKFEARLKTANETSSTLNMKLKQLEEPEKILKKAIAAGNILSSECNTIFFY